MSAETLVVDVDYTLPVSNTKVEESEDSVLCRSEGGFNIQKFPDFASMIYNDIFLAIFQQNIG